MTGMMSFGILVSLKNMLSGPAAQVTQSLRNIQRAANFGRTLQAAGAQASGLGALWTGISGQMRGAIESVMAPAMQFEDSLAAVRTVAAGTFGSVEADVAAVTRAAREWSLVHTNSAAEFAKASYLMVSAGLDTRQAIAGTRTALAVASATMGDATQATSLLGSLYINLGDKAADVTREMARLGDVVTRTQQYFKIADLGQLNEGLKYAVPVAKQYGISLEQLSMAVGTLNTAGLEGSMAGTAFGASMRQMISASRQLGFGIARAADGGIDFLKTIENIHAKFGDFNAMTDATRERLRKAFGDEGLRAVSIFMGVTGDMRRALGAVSASAGATGAAQQAMEATGSAAVRVLQNHFSDLKITLARDLEPTIRALVDAFKGVIASVKEFATAHPNLMAFSAQFAVLTAAALAVVGPMAMVAGSVMTIAGSAIRVIVGIVQLAAAFLAALPAAWAFAAALLANPITWIVLGVVALIGAIVALIVYWDKVSSAIRTTAGWLVQAFAAAWKWVKEMFTRAIAWLRENAILIGVILMGPMAWAVAAIIKYWEPIRGFFANLWTGIKTSVSGAINAVVESVTGFGRKFWEAGKALFGAMWDGMKSIAGSVVSWFEETLGSIRAFLPFSDAKEGPLSDLTRSGRALVQTWAGGMTAAMPVLAGAAERMAGQVMGALDGVMGFETPSIQAGTLSAGRQGPGSQPNRGVTIQHLTVQVQARDFREQDQFVDLLTSLADQYG